jgi:heptosyltransferase-3
VAVTPYALARRVLGLWRRRWRRRAAQQAVRQAERAIRAAIAEPGAILLVERLGDFVAASAVVALLRQRHPSLRLAWFGRERYRAIALAVPGVEHYVAVECYGELADVVGSLASWRVFDFNLNDKSCVCCGRPWRNLSGNRAVDTENYYDFGPLAAAFAAVAGVDWRPTPPALRRPEGGLGDLPRLPARYVLVHAESEESARNWRDAGWRALVERLLADTDLAVVHVGLRPAAWLPRGPRAVDLAGQTSGAALLAVVAGCSLFVGIDSSVAHIANAFERPGLVLLGRYRRFRSYLPYSGYYGAEGEGAFALRYPCECTFLPWEVVADALATVRRRLRVRPGEPPRLGRCGPWDVRAAQVSSPEAVDQLRQDAMPDAAAVLHVDGDEEQWLARWPGEGREVVLAIAPTRVEQLAGSGSLEPLLAQLEGRRARLLVEDGRARDGARRDGDGVRRDGGGEGELAAAGGDAAPPPPAAASMSLVRRRDPSARTAWRDLDLRGLRPAQAADRLAAAQRALAAARAAAADPAPGQTLSPRPGGLQAGIDEVQRGAGGAVVRVSGWLFLASTRTPPAVLCLAEQVADGHCVVRCYLPFSRLERPDVARACGAPGARFSGLRLDVPAELQHLGPALAVLVPDRTTDSWHRVELP